MNAMKFVVLLIFVGFVCANVGARQLQEVSKETKLGISIPKTVTTANGIGAELNYVSVTTTANNYENSNADADAGPGGPSGGGSGTVAKSTTGSVIAEGPDNRIPIVLGAVVPLAELHTVLLKAVLASLERLVIMFKSLHYAEGNIRQRFPLKPEVLPVRHLNLAGRLTLVSSVIPGAKFSWQDVCCPKVEGGLVLRNSASWNIVFGLKLIWLLHFRAGSLWVAWVSMKDLNRYSFWLSQLTVRNTSWMFQRLVNLCLVAQSLVFYEISCGGETYFWPDPWTPFVLLIQYLGTSGPSNLGISIDSLLSDCFVNGSWTLPHPCSERQAQLHIYISTLSLGHGMRVDGVTRNKFSSKEIWNYARHRRQPRSWTSLVWHSASIPKHAINSWLFMLNRNTTMDRLLSWSLDVEGTFLLCGLQQESRYHLFFECVFSAEVWRTSLIHLGDSNAPTSWQSVIDWLSIFPQDGLLKLVVLQIWQASLYGIRKERNRRFHLGTTVSPSKISDGAIRVERSKAITLKNSGRNLGSEILAFWSVV
ncbi:hypothetical protein Bca4012_042440 [Brassica carinata]